jgi:N-acetylmuramoyl-L-alanine amidase
MARSLLFLIALLAAGGCAVEPSTSTGVGGAGVPELPAYRDPREIRPGSVYMPGSVAADVPRPTVQSSTQRPAGRWAPPVASRRWQYIVIHHSASSQGNAAAFDREHRAKGWDELGYHFVIDNGAGGPDGRVEVGSRWAKQKQGAHAKTPRNEFNDFGVGICLVGNFDVNRPTAKQQAALAELVAWLMDSYDIPADRIIGHRDTGRQTACPGKHMNVATVRNRASNLLAQTGRAEPSQAVVVNSSTELLQSR